MELTIVLMDSPDAFERKSLYTLDGPFEIIVTEIPDRIMNPRTVTEILTGFLL
jgi:hypothetical protein